MAKKALSLSDKFSQGLWRGVVKGTAGALITAAMLDISGVPVFSLPFENPADQALIMINAFSKVALNPVSYFIVPFIGAYAATRVVWDAMDSKRLFSAETIGRYMASAVGIIAAVPAFVGGQLGGLMWRDPSTYNLSKIKTLYNSEDFDDGSNPLFRSGAEVLNQVSTLGEKIKSDWLSATQGNDTLSATLGRMMNGQTKEMVEPMAAVPWNDVTDFACILGAGIVASIVAFFSAQWAVWHSGRLALRPITGGPKLS